MNERSIRRNDDPAPEAVVFECWEGPLPLRFARSGSLGSPRSR